MACTTSCGDACMACPWKVAGITFVNNVGAGTTGESNTANYLGGQLPKTDRVEEEDDNQVNYQGISGENKQTNQPVPLLPHHRGSGGTLRAKAPHLPRVCKERPLAEEEDGDSRVCVTVWV